ncbi:MAG: ATP-binding cassette domain-containing protein [Planctomycetota bacterium]
MSSHHSHLLRLGSVSHQFQRGRRTVDAARDVSLNVDRGDFVVIRGPSGSGKSTLLLIAGGMMRPSSVTSMLYF